MGYSRLLQVTEWLQWVTAGYSRLQSGYSVLQQVTTAGYHSRLPSGYSWVTAGYSKLQSGYSRLQHVTEWLQGLRQVTACYRVVTVG